MMEMRPRDLRTGELLDVPTLLDTTEELFPQIMTSRPAEDEAGRRALFSSVGNRLLHPAVEGSSLASLLQSPLPRHVLASHAIAPEALLRLQAGDRLAFLGSRRDAIETAASKLLDSHAEWKHSDRPSILAMSDEED